MRGFVYWGIMIEFEENGKREMTIKRNGRVYEYNKDSHTIEVFDDKGKQLILISICFSTPMTEDDIVRFADIMLK